jgi:protein-tyrosine phosphatase
MLTGDLSVDVSSAGINAWAGHGMDALMAHEAELRGIDPGGHRARQLTGRMLKDADVVLVFGPEHVEWIAAEFPEHLQKVVGLGQVAAALMLRPRRALLGPGDLAMASRENGLPDDGSAWIKDPYRRGPDAAKTAADQIESAVASVLGGIRWTDI